MITEQIIERTLKLSAVVSDSPVHELNFMGCKICADESKAEPFAE